MKRLFLVLTLLLPMQSAFALSDTAQVMAPTLIDDPMPGYGMADFELTPFTRSQIQGSVYLSGSESSGQTRSVWDHRRSKFENSYSNLNLNLNSSLSQIDDDLERVYSASFSLGSNRSSYKSNSEQWLAERYENESKSSYGNDSFNGALLADWDRFLPVAFRLGLSLGLPANHNGSDQEHSSLYRSISPSFAITGVGMSRFVYRNARSTARAYATFRGGFGRIVAAEAAWKAARLAQALAAQGSLKRALEPAESQALAEAFVELLSAFAWNARDQRRAEALRLQAFFTERALVDPADAQALLACADSFDYPFQRRGRGWLALVELTQGMTYTHWEDISTVFSVPPLAFTVDPRRYQLRARVERPLSLEFQAIGQLSAALLDDWDERTGAYLERQSSRWDAAVEAGLSFHPGTRFSAALSDTFRVDAQHQDILPGNPVAGWVSRYDEMILNNQANLTFSYQSSFATWVNLSANLNWTSLRFSNEVYAANPEGGLSDAFDGMVVGLPVSDSQSLSYNLTVNHRFK